jgi:hypothetical protein
MELKEEKKVTEVKSVIVGHKCDFCGTIHEGKELPNEWHSFSHHHNQWGNDSVDTYKYHEVCSPKCYWIKFKECVEDLKEYENAKVDEFEIQFARRLVNLT